MSFNVSFSQLTFDKTRVEHCFSNYLQIMIAAALEKGGVKLISSCSGMPVGRKRLDHDSLVRRSVLNFPI